MQKRKRVSWGEPGSKVTRKTQATVRSKGKPRPVIVTVYPDGMIGLRLLKHRKEEYMPADWAYREAVIARVNYEKAKRKAERKARRA